VGTAAGSPVGVEQQVIDGTVHNVGTISSTTYSNTGANAIATGPFRVIPGEQLSIRSAYWGTGGFFVERLEYYTAPPPGGWDAYPVTEPPHFTYADLTGAIPATRTVFTATPTVPAGAVWARISLHHTGNNTKMWFDEATVSRASQDPNSFQATWNTQPPVDAASQRSMTNNYQNTYFPVDVTDWVRDWIANPAANFGIRMDMDGTGKRCSMTGGYLAVVYNEAPFDPTPTPVANTIVNGGFESGLFQWAPCINPDKVSITAETAQPGVAPATGRRYGKFVSATGVGYACQRFAYATNGLGNQRITVTAKVRSTQPVPLTFTIDQQGNPAQGAQYQLNTVQTSLTGGDWTSVTATMCEQTSANKVISAYFGTTSVATPIYIDDVVATVVPDNRPFIPGVSATSGCTPNPGVTGGNPVTPTTPTPPDGAHYFEAGSPTPLIWAQDSDLCVVINVGGLAILAGGATVATGQCETVIPIPIGGDGDTVVIGWMLQRQTDRSKCLGRTFNQNFGVIDCFNSNRRFADNALVFDSPGQSDYAFPMRLADTGGNPNNLCVTPSGASVGSSVVYSTCSTGVGVAGNQLWFDPTVYQIKVVGIKEQGGNNEQGGLAFLYTLTSTVSLSVSGRGFKEIPYSHIYTRNLNYDLSSRADKVGAEILITCAGPGSGCVGAQYSQIDRIEDDIFYDTSRRGDMQKDSRAGSDYLKASGPGFYSIGITLIVRSRLPLPSQPGGGAGLSGTTWKSTLNFCLRVLADPNKNMYRVANAKCGLDENPRFPAYAPV
jgi:hypothetical protein